MPTNATSGLVLQVRRCSVSGAGRRKRRNSAQEQWPSSPSPAAFGGPCVPCENGEPPRGASGRPLPGERRAVRCGGVEHRIPHRNPPLSARPDSAYAIVRQRVAHLGLSKWHGADRTDYDYEVLMS